MENKAMTQEERIDAALDAVLKASGSALRNYTMPSTLAAMRLEMKRALDVEYYHGWDDCPGGEAG